MSATQDAVAKGYANMMSECENAFDQIPRLQAIRWTQGTRKYTEHNSKFRVTELFYSVEELQNIEYQIVSYGKYNPAKEELYKGVYEDDFLELNAIGEGHSDAWRIVNPLFDNEVAILANLGDLFRHNTKLLQALFGDPEIITIDNQLRVTKQVATDWNA